MKVRFGTAGIRGLIYEEISPELCYVVSKALANHFGQGSKIALGYDTRPGGRKLAGVCASAMAFEGIEVINFGVAPSPLVCAMILERELDGGLMVSGSHLSYDRIGLIPLDSDGTIPPREKTESIERVVEEMEQPRPEQIMDVLPEPDTEYFYPYLEFIQGIVGEVLSGKGIKVALDPAGATGAGTVSGLMRDLGCDVVAINDEPTDFAPRRMEPRIDGVEELTELVLSKNADFGAAFDADCDRVLFVDDRGRPLSEDLAACLFARHIYDCGPGICVTPVNSSGLIKKVWKGTVEECIIGPPEISLAAKKHDAVFAYEESGKYFFPPKVLWADGIIATAMIAKILVATKRSLSDMVSEYSRHVQIKRNVKGAEEQMRNILKHVRENFQPADAKLNDIDGLKYVYDDGSWLLFRPSGTEPVMRVYVDSPSPERARELSETGMRIVEDQMEEM
jgi:phosphoglucosamine mutase